MLNLYLGKNYKSIRPNKNCETLFFCNRKIFFNHSKRELLNISKRDINYNTIIIKDTNNHRTKFLTETTFHDIHHKTSIQSPKKTIKSKQFPISTKPLNQHVPSTKVYNTNPQTHTLFYARAKNFNRIFIRALAQLSPGKANGRD